MITKLVRSAFSLRALIKLSFQQALDFAQKEFPELSHISRDHIEFTILASMGGERRMVRISESAWPAAVARLLRAEIIDINVRQDDSKEPPPLYLAVPQLTEGVHRKSLSAPSSPRSHSRSSSPSGRSEKGSSRHWFSKS